MVYEKQTWTNGDIITAEKLNNLEGGVSNATPLVVNVVFTEDDVATLDKTYNEIVTAISAGRYVYVLNSNNNQYSYCGIKNIYHGDSTYVVEIYPFGDKASYQFIATTPDGVLTNDEF